MSRFIRTACAIAVAAQFEAQVLTPVSAMCGCGDEAADAEPSDSTHELSEAEQDELRKEVAKKNKEAEQARLAAEKAAEETAALRKELSELHSLRPHKSAAENAADRPKIEELEAKLKALDSQEEQDEKNLAKIRAEAAKAYAAARKAGVPDSAEVKQLKKDARAKLQENMIEDNKDKAVSEEQQEMMDNVIKATDNLSEEQLKRFMKSVEENNRNPDLDADINMVLFFGPMISKIMSCTDKKELMEVMTKEPFEVKEEDFEQKFATMNLAQIKAVFSKKMEFEMMSPEERNEEIMKINDKEEFIMLMKNEVFSQEFSDEFMLLQAGVLSLEEIKSVLTSERFSQKVVLNGLVKKKVMACEKNDDLIEIVKALSRYDEDDRKEFESMSFEQFKAIIVEGVSPSRHAFSAGGVHMSHAMSAPEPRSDIHGGRNSCVVREHCVMDGGAVERGSDRGAMLRAHAAQHPRHHAVDALDECSSDSDSDSGSQEHLHSFVRHDGRGAPADLSCAVAGDVAPQRLGACRIAHSPRFRGSPRGAMVCEEGAQGYAIMCEPEPMCEPSVAVSGH